MKKILPGLLFIIFCYFFLTGCSSEESSGKFTAENETAAEEEITQSAVDLSIIGEWSESIFDSGYIFESDGTGEDTFWELTFTYTADGSTLVITYDSDTYGIAVYEYSIDNDTLSMTRISEDEETSEFEYERVG